MQKYHSVSFGFFYYRQKSVLLLHTIHVQSVITDIVSPIQVVIERLRHVEPCVLNPGQSTLCRNLK